MKIRHVAAVVGMVVFCGGNANGQEFEINNSEQYFDRPIPLVEDAEMLQENADFETYDPTISYYVQNLNLTPEQLDQAQRISEAGQAKKEELLRQIEALRREAYNLEAGSLIAFESILTDDQRAAFYELRTLDERKKSVMNSSAETGATDFAK